MPIIGILRKWLKTKKRGETLPMNEVKQKLDDLRNQIFKNLVHRGLVDANDEGMVKAELNVYRFHVWKIIFEELSSYFDKTKEQDQLV